MKAVRIPLEIRARWCLTLPVVGLRYLGGNSTPEHFGDCIERHCAAQHWALALVSVPEQFRPRATEYLRERYCLLRQALTERRQAETGSFAKGNKG